MANLIQNKVKTKAAIGASLVMILGLGVTLQGCHKADCTQGPNQAKYQEGVSDANAKMAQDSAKGTADGKALTYQQGKDATYASGYDVGFDNGYKSSNGYNKGYNDGKNQGKIDGLSDPTSCVNGNTDGYNVGYADGKPLGRVNGYEDGYDDGYNTGLPDGTVSCFGGGSNEEEDLKTCYNRGFNDVYSSEAYWSAYNTAAAANANYQTGRTDGYAQGKSDGFNPGVNRGYKDGKSDGLYDGYVVGAQIAYQNCYAAGYPTGYNAGYNNGYSDPLYGYGQSPTFGSISNGTGGFGDGYYDGYVDGRASTCGGTVEGATGVKRKGQNQEWAEMKNGVLVSNFAEKPISKTVKEADAKKLKAQIETYRKAKRVELRSQADMMVHGGEAQQ